MGNTAAVILLYRQVTGSAPSNAPLKDIVDMYIFIHACALNRNLNVTEQRMGLKQKYIYMYVHILVSKDSIY